MIKIEGKIIDYGKTPFIVAEAGVNHNGRLDVALKLIDEAKKAGATAIKFQTFKAEDVVISQGRLAKYQKKNLKKNLSQREMLRQLELKDEFYLPIIRQCKKRNIIFLSAPHGGFESVNFLHKLNVGAFKFGSGDLTNFPLLSYTARFNKPIILGTGMTTLGEVRKAINCIKKQGNRMIIALHCTTNYPCPFEEVNLSAMVTMMRKLDAMVGYSDHTLGIEVPVIATTLGAAMIERHFTLNKKMVGPDHRASADPTEFKEMVEAVNMVSIILGSHIKKPTKSEYEMIKTIRKSICSLRPIKKGDIFTKENIGIKRPGTGLKPSNYFRIIGKKAKRNVKGDTLLTVKDF